MDEEQLALVAEQLELMIDGTAFRGIRYNLEQGQVKLVIVVSKGCNLANIAARFLDPSTNDCACFFDPAANRCEQRGKVLDEAGFREMLTSKQITLVLPSHTDVDGKWAECTIPLASIPESTYCHVILLPPVYLVQLDDD